MGAIGWKRVTAWGDGGGDASLREIDEILRRAQAHSARFAADAGNTAVLARFDDVCGGPSEGLSCTIRSESGGPHAAEWLLFASSSTGVTELLDSLHEMTTDMGPPHWLVLPVDSGAAPGRPAGRFEVSAGAGRPSTVLELRSLRQPSAAERLRAGAAKLPEPPDNLRRRGEWFHGKTHPAE